MALKNSGTRFTPSAPTSVGQVVFDIDTKNNHIYWTYILWASALFPKIDFKNWSVLSAQSFATMLYPLLSLKILANEAVSTADVSAFSDFISGQQIPVLAQNCINCMPTLNRIAVLPTQVGPFQLDLDVGGNLRTWAKAQIAGINYVQYQNNLRNWTNPQLYKGALTTASFLTRDYSTVLANVQFTNPATGTPEAIPNLQMTPTSGPKAVGGTISLADRYTQADYNFETLDSQSLTPQFIWSIMFLGVQFTGFRTAALAVNLPTYQISSANMGSKENALVRDVLTQFPNPEVLSPSDTEGQKPKPRRPEKESSSPPKTAMPTVKIKATKIRKSETGKVSGVSVSFDIKNKKDLDPNLVKSVNVLLQNVFIQTERIANKLQVDSVMLYQELSNSWKNAKDIIDPDFGEDV